MRRSEFIALMLSPLLAPFVKADKGLFNKNVTDASLVGSAYGSKMYHYTSNPIPYDTYPGKSFKISEAERKEWLEGDWYTRDEIMENFKHD